MNERLEITGDGVRHKLNQISVVAFSHEQSPIIFLLIVGEHRITDEDESIASWLLSELPLDLDLFAFPMPLGDTDGRFFSGKTSSQQTRKGGIRQRVIILSHNFSSRCPLPCRGWRS